MDFTVMQNHSKHKGRGDFAFIFMCLGKKIKNNNKNKINLN